MTDDDGLAAVLHRAVGTLEPPVDRLVAGGVARGRRRRRLVRTGEAFTGATLVAGVVTLIVTLVPGSAHPTQRTNQAGGPSATAPAATGDVPATPQALLQTALDTLPRAGTTSGYDGSTAAGFVGAQFVYDDGHGAAKVSVSLDYPPSGGGLGKACQISVCTTRADGSKLAVYQGNGRPGSASSAAKDWEVTLLRTDGVAVSLTEWNSPQEKSATLTRAEPPFTIAELTAWAGRGAWTTTISRQRDLATSKLFAPANPKPGLSAAQASKSANAEKSGASDRLKEAKLARERAACAAAKAARQALPAFCATIK